MTPEDSHNLSFLKVLLQTTWELQLAARPQDGGAYYTCLPEMAQFYRIISRYKSRRLTILKQTHYY